MLAFDDRPTRLAEAVRGYMVVDNSGGLRGLAMRARALAINAYIERSWAYLAARRRPHGLECDLTVSLTSYPKRFPTLAATLHSLLAQSVRPTRLILWLDEGDRAALPPEVTALEAHGLSIRCCENIRSYKKIVPTLREYPRDIVVTADDDVYYRRGWLADLIATRKIAQRDGIGPEVICARAHLVKLREDGLPQPYYSWDFNTDLVGPASVLFPTGCGGVLYEPGILHPDVTNSELFMRMCPTTDDVWLFWMASIAGVRFRRVPRHNTLVTWEGSQDQGLYHANNQPDGGNDRQIGNLIERYGWPVGSKEFAEAR